MNYDQPRQALNADGTPDGWHWTSKNRRTGTHAIGYCRDHPPHDTEDEARECYTRYLMNERLQLDSTLGDYNPCQADDCDTLTNRAAAVGGWHLYRLCDEHRDRAHVEALFGLASNSIHS